MIFDQPGQRTTFSNSFVLRIGNLALVRFKMANSRFHKTSAVEIQSLVNKTKNSNTDISTKTWVSTFSAWAKKRRKLRAGEAGPTTPTLVEPKNLLICGQSLVISVFRSDQ